MKKLLFLIAFVCLSAVGFAQTNNKTIWVDGYTNSNGTYVSGYERTAPNKTNWDNYSTKPNYNLHTGTSGSRAKDYTPEAYNYGRGQQIHTGSRGGQFYYNSNGNKTYVPKRPR